MRTVIVAIPIKSEITAVANGDALSDAVIVCGSEIDRQGIGECLDDFGMFPKDPIPVALVCSKVPEKITCSSPRAEDKTQAIRGMN